MNNLNENVNVKVSYDNNKCSRRRGFKLMSVIAFVFSIISASFTFLSFFVPRGTFSREYLQILAFGFGCIAMAYGLICLINKYNLAKAITSLALGFICFTVILYSIIVPYVFESFDFNDMTKEEVEYILENEVDVEIKELPTSGIDSLFEGIDFAVDLEISNITDRDISSVKICIEAMREDGRHIATDTVYVYDLDAGNYVYEEAFTDIDSQYIKDMANAKFEISSITVRYKNG